MSNNFNFGSLLDQQFSSFQKGFNQGDVVTANVVRIGPDFVTLDVNAKLVGLMPVTDVTDKDGNITIQKGDDIEVTFVAMKKDYFLFAKADVALSDAMPSIDATLQHAFDHKIAMQGKVEKEIKGGYEVTIAGQRAFCPFSQIDRFRTPQSVYVGETFPFVISEYSTDDRGLNIIVSRKAIQDKELEVAREYLWDTLSEGQTINGTVANVTNFGAFVELGGIQGLVPLREISWDKVVDPHKFVKTGNLVTVKVISIDRENERVSLSIRQCQARPLKPRSAEELAREAEEKDVNDWMEESKTKNASFSSLASAFDNLKLK
ncbi:MAG: S1 RNA-binding domain-containing protein [Kiritimatiellae bacterium]|nr:S1 RNA-binding domain-containing protein [Kiritimatiellia bacterium]